MLTSLPILALLSFVGSIYVGPNAAVCEPFHTDFTQSSISTSSAGPTTSFVALSPPDSYQVTDRGLELYLQRPEGTVTRKGNTNDKIADGATVNSTCIFQNAKITFVVAAPAIPGVVTAIIVIGDDSRDEIDIELLGGDPKHWQTNVFGPSVQDPSPHYGRFNTVLEFPTTDSIEAIHSYSIDWDKERIIWSVDGKVKRTLYRKDTLIGGIEHYPSHASRLQLGIWDASTPVGTSKWAKGPIDWNSTPSKVSAVIRSVTVECPYA